MKGLEIISRENRQLACAILDQGGFITEDQLPQIVAIDPKLEVLVRRNLGRDVISVDKVAEYCIALENRFNILEVTYGSLEGAVRHGGDWVRDVSLLA